MKRPCGLRIWPQLQWSRVQHPLSVFFSLTFVLFLSFFIDFFRYFTLPVFVFKDSEKFSCEKKTISSYMSSRGKIWIGLGYGIYSYMIGHFSNVLGHRSETWVCETKLQKRFWNVFSTLIEWIFCMFMKCRFNEEGTYKKRFLYTFSTWISRTFHVDYTFLPHFFHVANEFQHLFFHISYVITTLFPCGVLYWESQCHHQFLYSARISRCTLGFRSSR